MHSCTLKHRPPVLPQDAVFQLFKPRLKLAAQPLEGKAGRIPVITVWLVEWLQLASVEDLHSYKKLREARCGYCKVPYSTVVHSRSWEQTKSLDKRIIKLQCYWNKYEKSVLCKDNDMSMVATVHTILKLHSVYTIIVSSQPNQCQTRNRYHPSTYKQCGGIYLLPL